MQGKRTGGDEGYAHLLSVNAERAGNRAHRDATAVQFHCICGFLDGEAVLTAHDVVSGEVLRDGCTVHTILLSEVSDAETSEVIVDKSIYFCGGERGSRFSNPPDAGPSHVLYRGANGPL